MQGVWKYFTVDDHQIQDLRQNYLLIGTLEAYGKLRDYFGKERVVPIYIEVEDGIRLERAIGRERQQREPHYEEMCRRFLADAADLDAQITMRFVNDDLKQTEENIRDYILSQND